MRCLYCTCNESRVIDSRYIDDDTRIKRRRECISCGQRFTTYEVAETFEIIVIKKDKSRQPFNREKILKGLLRGCEKRPVSLAQMEEIISQLELHFYRNNKNEVESSEIGNFILERLRGIDEVSYIRFASVYKHFDDIESFLYEIKNISSRTE